MLLDFLELRTAETLGNSKPFSQKLFLLTSWERPFMLFEQEAHPMYSSYHTRVLLWRLFSISVSLMTCNTNCVFLGKMSDWAILHLKLPASSYIYIAPPRPSQEAVRSSNNSVIIKRFKKKRKEKHAIRRTSLHRIYFYFCYDGVFALRLGRAHWRGQVSSSC